MTPSPARSRPGALLIAAGLLAITFALGACSEDIGDKVAERVAEEQLGDGAEVDVDAGSGKVRIDDGDGGSYVGGTGLPEDFPDEVPLVEGEVLNGAAVKDGGSVVWTVTVQVAGADQEAFDAAVQKLEGAGFDLATEIQSGLYGGQLDNGKWSVVLAVYGDATAGTAVVGYTVGDSSR
ncbi:MAG: hypothetical protein NTX33_05320 [Propionibacteriales bacterium]|nr:hypothetical protein [Propionibacteriales bacterium]